MTEHQHADPRPVPSGWHLQASKLLMVMVTTAVAATGALIVTLITGLGEPHAGPAGMPPPPPDAGSAELTVVTGLFVLAWLAVLVVFARDQILLRLRQQTVTDPGGGAGREELAGLLAEMRAGLAADFARDMAALGDRLAELTGEYGERRETDGYLSGMRMATSDEPAQGNVRSLRRTPPPR